MKGTSFKILNSTDKSMRIIHEPECVEFELPVNKEIEILVENVESAIVLRYSLENGAISVAILDDKSYYRVIQKGIDVFEDLL